jgi:ABC-2 type transport system permease protein
MKRFAGFLYKEIYHIIRDVRTLVVLIAMPVIQLLLFGYVLTNEIKDARIAILDHSKDEVTAELTQKLLSSGYFILDKELQSEQEIHTMFREGNIKEVIVFEKDFSRKFYREGKARMQIINDASEPNTANLLLNYTNSIIADFVRQAGKATPTTPGIIPEARMAYNSNLKGVFMFVPGIIAMLLILISAPMTSITITREKELGTMEVLLVSPLRPIQIVLGKVAPYILISFLNVVIILLVSNIVFEVPVRGSIVLLLAECTLYIITALSLGILISTITNSQQVAMMLSLIGLMLPTIMLSGFIYPVENMPLPLQVLCQIMPPKWFIIIIKNIMLKGAGFAYVWKETLVLSGMTLFFIMLSVKKFKNRLE